MITKCCYILHFANNLMPFELLALKLDGNVDAPHEVTIATQKPPLLVTDYSGLILSGLFSPFSVYD